MYGIAGKVLKDYGWYGIMIIIVVIITIMTLKSFGYIYILIRHAGITVEMRL